MGKITHWLKKTGASILLAVRRFPLTLGLAAVIMVLALILIHCEGTLSDAAQKWLVRISLTLGLGIPLSVALQLYLERRDTRPLPFVLAAWAVLAGALALYLFFLLPGLDNMVHGMRFIAFMLASVAIVPAVPYLMNKRGDERFALKLLLRLFVTGIFTGILIGGVDLILLMLDKLLAVKLGDHAYMDVATVSVGLFSPAFLLAGAPKGDTDWDSEPFQPLVKVLFGYIVFPLLAAYTVIIHAYFLRILIQWSWPSNMLVNMVLWYTVAGVLAVYFMRTQSVTNRWFRLFDRWYPRLTVLPIALAFTGIGIRIGVYGFTESRYFVLVLATWVAAATAVALFGKPDRRRNVLIPALLAVLAVLAVLGPWSAFNVSAASQNARLEAIFRQNGMLSPEGKVMPKPDIPDKDKQQVHSILDYFSGSERLQWVRSLPAGTDASALPAVLGFDRAGYPGEPNASYYISAAMPQSAIDIAGYDYLFVSMYGKGQPSDIGGLTMKTDDQSVFTVLRDGKVVYTKDLKEYAKSYEGSYTVGRTYTQEELTFLDENDAVKVKFIINEASMNMVNNTPVYAVPSFYALVKVK